MQDLSISSAVPDHAPHTTHPHMHSHEPHTDHTPAPPTRALIGLRKGDVAQQASQPVLEHPVVLQRALQRAQQRQQAQRVSLLRAGLAQNYRQQQV